MNTTLPDPDGHLAGPADVDDGDIGRPGAADPTGATGERTEGGWFGDRLASTLHRPDDGIIGGVAVELAYRLGIDVLWVRLAFVVLLLVGGIGAVLYAGVWLTLIVGREKRWARVTGGAILLVLVPLILVNGDLDLFTGTGAVILLLVGIALALWHRGREGDPVRRDRTASVISRDVVTPDWESDTARDPIDQFTHEVAHRGVRARRRRPPSILGQATLALAVVVAATGALIDQLNGGSNHPEQWLGAAAVVCGLGLLVGTVRGHARWLVLPAAAFAAVGYVGGEMADVGLGVADIGGGDHHHNVFDEPGFSGDASLTSAFGNNYIDVQGVPDETATIDVVSAFGDVSVTAGNEVVIELRVTADKGRVDVNGRSIGSGTHRIGPQIESGAEPDVVINARTLHGNVSVFTSDRGPVESQPAFIDEQAFLTIGEGAMATSDGTVVLLDGQAMIDPGNQPILGDWFDFDSGLAWESEYGTWQLVRGILITPFGEVLDLNALRFGLDDGQVSETGDETVTPVVTSVPPTSTIAPQEG